MTTRSKATSTSPAIPTSPAAPVAPPDGDLLRKPPGRPAIPRAFDTTDTMTARHFDVCRGFDGVFDSISLTETLLTALARHLERYPWTGGDPGGDDDGGRRREHLAHLVDAAREASMRAVIDGRRFAEELIRAR
jgi:hypothetical protein